MRDWTFAGNLIESGVWMLVALVLVVKAVRDPAATRRVLLFLAITTCVFGISDIIESQTGAWWKPFWLLLMKAACIAGIGNGFCQYYRIRSRESAGSSVPQATTTENHQSV